MLRAFGGVKGLGLCECDFGSDYLKFIRDSWKAVIESDLKGEHVLLQEHIGSSHNSHLNSRLGAPRPIWTW